MRLPLYAGSEAPRKSALCKRRRRPPCIESRPLSVGDIKIGPLGGFHQYPLFAEIESLARQAIYSVAHLLLTKGEPAAPLHTVDGMSHHD